jgi:hypothetical protein
MPPPCAGALHLVRVTVIALLFSVSCSSAQTSESMKLASRFTRRTRFERPFATRVIGRPELADARVQPVGASPGSAAPWGSRTASPSITDTEVRGSIVIVGAQDVGKLAGQVRSQLRECWAYRCSPIISCVSKIVCCHGQSPLWRHTAWAGSSRHSVAQACNAMNQRSGHT